MFGRSSLRKGFTLVEALVAILLVAIGVAGAVKGVAGMTKSQAITQERERMVRLCTQKLDELIAINQTESIGGTFQDDGEDRYLWEANYNTTSVENLRQVKVTVKLADEIGRVREETLDSLVYIEPATTEATN